MSGPAAELAALAAEYGVVLAGADDDATAVACLSWIGILRDAGGGDSEVAGFFAELARIDSLLDSARGRQLREEGY